MAETIKNLSVISNRPKGTVDRFFPVSASVGAPLRRHGIELAGLSHNVPGYCISRPDPEFHLVVFSLRGCGYLDAGSRRMRVPEGRFFVARAHVPQTYGIEGGIWETFWVHLSDAPPWKSIGKPGNQRAVYKIRSPLHSAMEGFLREAKCGKPGSRQAALMYAELMRVFLERELLGEKGPRPLELEARFDTLWEKVGRTPEKNWNLKNLSKELSMSPVHFLRSSKKITGAPPVQTLRKIRMFRAQELLTETGLSVEAIADRVGYADPFAFSKAFHRFSGFSPAVFRGSRAQPYHGSCNPHKYNDSSD